jgi:hypothetical protein
VEHALRIRDAPDRRVGGSAQCNKESEESNVVPAYVRYAAAEEQSGLDQDGGCRDRNRAAMRLIALVLSARNALLRQDFVALA